MKGLPGEDKEAPQGLWCLCEGNPPGAEDGLQQRAQARHKENGGDELALGNVVVLDAERLGQDEGDRNDATESKDIMLQRRGKTYFFQNKSI